MARNSEKRVALVHDFLVQDGGAEQVLRVIARMFPKAPIYTLIADYERAAGTFERTRVRASYLQQFPLSVKKYQWFLPLMHKAIEAFDFQEFDVVVSDASAFAKGVKTPEHVVHVCYCHSPTRYLWTETESYIADLRIPSFIKRMLPLLINNLRAWDYKAAQRPDVLIANSQNVAKRIQKYYDREAPVIYPPIPVESFIYSEKKGNYFLAGGRIVGYKRFDIVVDAFNAMKIPLKVFGTGPFLDELKAKAKPNIEFLGWCSDEQIKKLYSEAKGFINPQEEDFGITMVEALASGCPVIAYNKGGAQEIVEPGVTGELFDEQTWESLANSVVRLREKTFDYAVIRTHASRFSEDTFIESLRTLIDTYEKKDSR